MIEPTYSRANELLQASVGEEMVALDPQRGACFGFNQVARDVWRLLAEPRTLHQLQEILVADYDVDTAKCETELAQLLHTMIDQGLINKAI